MKFGRLLRILLTLQQSGRKTTAELARALEVSQRTIYRDVEALAAAGIPVYAERGRLGGVVLSEGYRRALAQLTADDVRSLLTQGTDPLADLGLQDRHRDVGAQLLGALPVAERVKALAAQRRVFVDQRRWYQGAQPADVLRTLREAAFADRCIEIEYRDRAGTLSRRPVEPLGLVCKAGVWYLVATSAGKPRTFRADRIVQVVALDATFERPADFDLQAHWTQSTQSLEAPRLEYWITLRIARHVFDGLAGAFDHEIVDRDAGIVRINFGTASDASWRLFGWRDDAEVLGPPEFIEELVRRSQRIIERYAAAIPHR